MIEVRAVVLRVEGSQAWVRVSERAGGCGRCDEPGGCGSAKISHAFKAPVEAFAIPNAIGARAGEAVRVRIDDGAPLRAALATYGLASALVVAGAAVGATLAADVDTGAVVGLAGGLGLALLVNGILLRSRGWRGSLKMTLVRDEGGLVPQCERA